MDSDEEAAFAAIVITGNIKPKIKKKTNECVKPWLSEMWNSHGFHSELLCELHLEEKDFAIFILPNLNFFSLSIFSEIYNTLRFENLSHVHF